MLINSDIVSEILLNGECEEFEVIEVSEWTEKETVPLVEIKTIVLKVYYELFKLDVYRSHIFKECEEDEYGNIEKSNGFEIVYPHEDKEMVEFKQVQEVCEKVDGKRVKLYKEI